MKKALALVLALVLALSMAVSAFATLVELDRVVPTAEVPEDIYVVDMEDDSVILYTRPFMPVWDDELTDSYVTYIALDPAKNYKDIVLTANGNIDAELVKYDPETMAADGALTLHYYVVDAKGDAYAVDADVYEEVYEDFCTEPTGKYVLAAKNGDDLILAKDQNKLINDRLKEGKTLDAIWKEVFKASYGKTHTGIVEILVPAISEDSYEFTTALAKALNTKHRVTYFDVVAEEYINIIKLTVENNFSAHYTEGTLKIEAKLDKKAVAKTLTVINDVSIFEYEEVKYAAVNNAKGATLQLGEGGYSDYETAVKGYGEDYKVDELREYPCALVVSTTAFRAIAGEDLTLDVFSEEDYLELSVTLKEIAAGQKGVNFFAWSEYTFEDTNDDGEKNGYEDFETMSFGFMGDQIIKGKFSIDVELGMNYYDLREMFGEKVEEDDIITYYVIDENNEVVKTIKVDYMTFDPTENVEFSIEGENEKLGWYTLTMEVPAVETEGEANPNTGAESVVGVVAALAVVSVATAAAVSLKK